MKTGVLISNQISLNDRNVKMFEDCLEDFFNAYSDSTAVIPCDRNVMVTAAKCMSHVVHAEIVAPVITSDIANLDNWIKDRIIIDDYDKQLENVDVVNVIVRRNLNEDPKIIPLIERLYNAGKQLVIDSLDGYESLITVKGQ